MNYFFPDIYRKSIYNIDYDKLKEIGVKCLLFDLDNTCVSYKEINVPKELKYLFTILEENFKIIILSNASYNRLKNFKEELNVDTCAYSCKPLKFKINKIMKMFNFKICDMAIIGDQLLTDIFLANRIGITSILVNPISSNDFFLTKINRKVEDIIFDKMKQKGIFKIGVYYE